MAYKDYAEFNAAKEACRDCYVGKTYNKVIPSDGCKNPKVLIIGEAPGNLEVEQGKPFVGRAGKLLRVTLSKHGFNETNSLISNVLPCRPEGNKFPKEEDIVEACVNKWLMQEIELVKPKYILLVGSTSLYYLLKIRGITVNRGKWFYLSKEQQETGEGVQCMPTYHPSYVLRKMYMTEGKQILEHFENDIKEVAIKAGIYK